MSQDQQYVRESAMRVLASELEASDYHFKEEDSERAPNYLLLPSGARANRVMMGGTLMEVEDTSNDSSPFWKARINDGTGEFLAFAGQYEPEAASTLQSVAQADDKPPAFVLLTGKTREYRPEDDESEVIVNVRPERIALVDEEQRNIWLKETAEHTLKRLESDEGDYVRQSEDRYGNRTELLKEGVVTALENIE